jgi:hypothetical protein
MGDEDWEGPPSGGRVPPAVTYAALGALLLLTILVALWEYLTSLYALMVVAWLVVAGGLVATPLFRRLSAVDGLRLTMAVFLLALGWRLLMLFQDEVLTNDIVSFVGRGQAYLAGQVPYTEDFQVLKPPAYLYLAAGMGASVGPSLLMTRAIMSIVDALVAVMIFWIGEERFGRSFGLMAALLYAVNPISAVSVAISGHFDPWVVAFALGGVWLGLRGRPGGASLLLGVGFALKLYPIVLLPWILLMERSWPRRVAFAVIFFLPMVISWVPVLLQNPEAFSFYAEWQGNWIPKKGIAAGIATIIGLEATSDVAGNIARVVELVFYCLLVVMFFDWVRRRNWAPDAHLLGWFRVVASGFLLLYGLTMVGGVVEYELDLGFGTNALAALAGLAYLAFAITTAWWLFTRRLPADHGFTDDDRFIMLAALSVNLLLLSSAQYNPWYLLWLLPLVLLVRSWRIRDAWNALLVWNAEGRGVRIWPGTDVNPPLTP